MGDQWTQRVSPRMIHFVPRSLGVAGGVVLFLIPLWAHAAVVINEIAWMGTVASANDEWIELYNNGTESISVDGWILSDGMDLSVTLTGSIGGGSYAVLERTDDSSAPGSAFLIYTGALTNAGATLSLTRSDGSIEDRVAGGENWIAIGGDNTTKETPQHTSAGWITNTPTPGAQNQKSSSTPQEETQPPPRVAGATSAKEEKNERISLTIPNTSLAIVLSIPKVGHVNQPLTFSATPAGISNGILNSVVFTWNFGDANSATGTEVTHTYPYPGEYVISAYGSYARHESSARQSITILPVHFSLSATTGAVLVHNDAPYEVDLSGYTLSGKLNVRFPERSIMLPRATLTIPNAKLGITSSSTVTLYDRQGKKVASTDDPQAIPAPVADVTAEPAPLIREPISSPEEASTEEDSFTFTESEESPLAGAVILSTDETTSSSPVISEIAPLEKSSFPKNSLPYLGFMGVLAIGAAALFVGRGE